MRGGWNCGPRMRPCDHRFGAVCAIGGAAAAGQADYLMHALVGEIGELLRMQISRMPGIERLMTRVWLETIKARAPLTGCRRP